MTTAVTRRGFLRGLGVMVVGGVGGFLVARNSEAARSSDRPSTANSYGYSPPKSPSTQPLAAVDRIPVGGGVVLSDDKLVITRGANGSVRGFSAICTHEGCTVDAVRDGHIDCPCHGSRFDATTGARLSGPARAPLSAVSLVVRGGNVYAG